MRRLHWARIGACSVLHETSFRSIFVSQSESNQTNTFVSDLSSAISKPRSTSFSYALVEVQLPIFSIEPHIHSPWCPRITPPPPLMRGPGYLLRHHLYWESPNLEAGLPTRVSNRWACIDCGPSTSLLRAIWASLNRPIRKLIFSGGIFPWASKHFMFRHFHKYHAVIMNLVGQSSWSWWPTIFSLTQSRKHNFCPTFFLVRNVSKII